MKLEVLENQNLIEVEQKILGIAMHSPNALVDIVSSLTTDDFFISSHKIIFDTIMFLHKNGIGISSTTIIDQLENTKKLKNVGGIEGIEILSDTFYGDEGLNELIAIIFQKSMARKIDQTLLDIMNMRKEKADLNSVLDKAQNFFLKINLSYKKDETEVIEKSMQDLIEKIKQLEKNPSELTGISSGFRALDKITSGFQKGDFIILAARPSMGKTAFALNLALNAVSHIQGENKQTNSVVIFSIEMPKEQLSQRILSSMAKIEPFKLRTGQKLDANDWRKIYQAKQKLSHQKLFIDDNPGLNIHQLQSKLYKLKRDENINYCIIDYLQLIQSLNSSGDNRQNEISNISRQLKRIARDLEITIICLSQLSRSVEKREDRRPMMSDLRDSGAIEQDADMVMFLYREDYYKNKQKENLNYNNNNNQFEDKIQETELIISKHRNGSTGVIKLSFNLEYGKFTDML